MIEKPSDTVTFGSKPTYQEGAEGTEFAVSRDGKAFTLTFSDFQIAVDAGKLPAPVATRAFIFVVPLAGGEKGVEIPFRLDGFAGTTEGANATVMLIVNGQSAIVHFPPNTNRGFVHTVTFKADAASECRVTVLFLAERDGKHPDAGATLTASSIDAETAPAQ